MRSEHLFGRGVQPLIVNAESEDYSITLSAVEGYAGETVTVYVVSECKDNLEGFDIICQFDSALISTTATPVNGTSVVSDAGKDYVMVTVFGMEPLADGKVAKIDFTVPENAEGGTVYDLEITTVNGFFEFGGDDLAESVSVNNGSITVISNEYDFNYKKVDEDYNGTYDYVEITNCDRSATEIVIPSEIDGLPVTSIGDDAFSDCYSLENIEIPNSVTSIGGYAFSDCESLKSIEIPDSVTSIGDSAFSDCDSLESIEVSEDNNYYSSTDGVLFNKEQTELIIYPCSKTEKSYTIPDSVKNIRDSAFSDCDSLENIEIPNSVTSIGDDAFSYCYSLESITIENPDCKIYDSKYTICNGYDDNGDYYFNGTIYGYLGSTAQSYAEKYEYKFALIGDETLLGDANGDGELNVRDCAFIARLLSEGRKDELPVSADYNGDGEINVRDASMIARFLANKKA